MLVPPFAAGRDCDLTQSQRAVTGVGQTLLARHPDGGKIARPAEFAKQSVGSHDGAYA